MEKKVDIRYDPEVDIAYFLVNPGKLADGKEISDDVFAEYDKSGNLIAIEVHNVSQTLKNRNVIRKIERFIPELKGNILADLKPLSKARRA